MKTLTIKEAIEQGYKFCGEDRGEWQTLTRIDSLQENDEWLVNGALLLAEKDYDNPGIDAESLADLLADHISNQWSDETGDDTDEVLDTIKKLDFQKFSEYINDSLTHVKSYKLTDIKLVP